MMKQQQQQNERQVHEHDAAGLMDDLLGRPAAPKSDFEKLLEGSVVLGGPAQEMAVSEPAKYPAENSVFSSITEYAPEPERKRRKMCPICGRADCWLAIDVD